MSGLLERYLQDRILEIAENDTDYCDLNQKILEAEKEVKKAIISSNGIKKYNELEELVIKSITHLVFTTCKNILESPPPYTTLTPT